MDHWGRRELQKLCTEAKNSGKLPKGTKCNGTNAQLLKILEGVFPTLSQQREPKSTHLVPKSPLKDSKSSFLLRSATYEHLLRSLAPYLTHDKLLLFLAYFPRHSLLKEVKDLKGKIWSDRVWVELRDTPIPVRSYGTRYYSQWVNQSLLPWGRLVVQNNVTDRWVQFEVVQTNKDIMPGQLYQDIFIWARTPRGLEFIYVNVLTLLGIKDTNVISLQNSDNWTLVSKKDFIFLGSHEYGFVLALDRGGNLHKYTRTTGKSIEDEIIKTGVHYLRRVDHGKYFYGITSGGTPFVLNSQGEEIEIHSPPLKGSTRLYPGFLGLFERLVVKPFNWESYSIGDRTVDIHKDSFIDYSGVESGRLYYLPMGTQKESLESTGTLLKESQERFEQYFQGRNRPLNRNPLTEKDDSLLLGLDGVIYRKKSPKWDQKAIEYEIVYRAPQGRLQSFSNWSFMGIEKFSGVLW